MADCEHLLARARATPASLRFSEACTLAECFGFVLARQKGSHRIYKRSGTMQLVNLQPLKHGMAKRVQVAQVINIIDELGL